MLRVYWNIFSFQTYSTDTHLQRQYFQQEHSLISLTQTWRSRANWLFLCGANMARESGEIVRGNKNSVHLRLRSKVFTTGLLVSQTLHVQSHWNHAADWEWRSSLSLWNETLFIGGERSESWTKDHSMTRSFLYYASCVCKTSIQWFPSCSLLVLLLPLGHLTSLHHMCYWKRSHHFSFSSSLSLSEMLCTLLNTVLSMFSTCIFWRSAKFRGQDWASVICCTEAFSILFYWKTLSNFC